MQVSPTQASPAGFPELRIATIQSESFEDGVSLHGDVGGAYITTDIYGNPKFPHVDKVLRKHAASSDGDIGGRPDEDTGFFFFFPPPNGG